MKAALVVCFALLVTLAPASALPKKNSAAVYKFVLSRMNPAFAQLKEQKSDCADCAISLTETIADCILISDTTEGIIQCVMEVVGSAGDCFPCICDVLSLFDIHCPEKH